MKRIHNFLHIKYLERRTRLSSWTGAPFWENKNASENRCVVYGQNRIKSRKLARILGKSMTFGKSFGSKQVETAQFTLQAVQQDFLWSPNGVPRKQMLVPIGELQSSLVGVASPIKSSTLSHAPSDANYFQNRSNGLQTAGAGG
jgi:hypothetical protein